MRVSVDALRGELRPARHGWKIRGFVILTFDDHGTQEWTAGSGWGLYQDPGRQAPANELLDTLESILYDLSKTEYTPVVRARLTATWTGIHPAGEKRLVALGLADASKVEVPPDIGG